MVEFRVVVGDTRSKATDPVVKVKVKGDPELEFSSEEKERRRLPKCKANPKLLERLNAELGIITLRFRQEEKKINFTCRVEPDESLPEDTVVVSLEWLGEKVGAEEAEAEAFRAKSWQIVVSGAQAEQLVGRRIGDIVDASIVGLPGLKLKIRGGSDNSGFPMHPGVQGPVKKRVLLSGPPGFHPREDGERRRKTVRGNTISPDIVQVNTALIYPKEWRSPFIKSS